MDLMECATDCGMSYQTILRWVKAGKFPTKKTGFQKKYVEPKEWEKFCKENNINRKGE